MEDAEAANLDVAHGVLRGRLGRDRREGRRERVLDRVEGALLARLGMLLLLCGLRGRKRGSGRLRRRRSRRGLRILEVRRGGRGEDGVRLAGNPRAVVDVGGSAGEVRRIWGKTLVSVHRGSREAARGNSPSDALM